MPFSRWIVLSLVLAGGALAQSGGDYDVTQATVTAGGGNAQGGAWSVSSSMGQISATPQAPSGGAWSVAGGMWPAIAASDVPELLFADGFEP